MIDGMTKVRETAGWSLDELGRRFKFQFGDPWFCSCCSVPLLLARRLGAAQNSAAIVFLKPAWRVS
jgi:hypothetical protein